MAIDLTKPTTPPDAAGDAADGGAAAGYHTKLINGGQLMLATTRRPFSRPFALMITPAGSQPAFVHLTRAELVQFVSDGLNALDGTRATAYGGAYGGGA